MGEGAPCASPTVRHEVDLHEARLRVAPVRESAHGDLAAHGRPRSLSPAASVLWGAGGGEKAVYRRGADPEQFPSEDGIKLEMVMLLG